MGYLSVSCFEYEEADTAKREKYQRKEIRVIAHVIAVKEKQQRYRDDDGRDEDTPHFFPSLTVRHIDIWAQCAQYCREKSDYGIKYMRTYAKPQFSFGYAECHGNPSAQSAYNHVCITVHIYRRNQRLSQNSVFGKATLNLLEKADIRLLFRKSFPKPTGFGERLIIQFIDIVVNERLVMETRKRPLPHTVKYILKKF
jgi:hypothetical protein